MVKTPFIKIPSVRVGSIVPTSNIGTGGATPAPPTPITYLTQWKIVGNSEVHGNEIWSCGEYNAVDGKYHILVQPEGYSVVDIALDEPLRKVNDVADSIEYADGVATLTRNIGSSLLTSLTWNYASSLQRVYSGTLSSSTKAPADNNIIANIICEGFTIYSFTNLYREAQSYGIAIAGTNNNIYLKDDSFIPESGYTLPQALTDYITGKHIIFELDTPTTELVDAPQIEEAESYSCVISQGGKAVEWSSFSTNSE